MRPVPLALLGSLALTALAPARADLSRRFFDFTPISPDNPVVVTIDGTLQIPFSELRAYRETEKLRALTDPASLPQKRALLDDLVNEYLYVDEAYRTGVVQSLKFSKQMETTRTMILTDLMSTRAIQEKKPAPEAAAAATALADRLFDAATIDISNEAYALLQRAAAKVDQTSAASHRGPLVDSPDAAAAKLYAIIQAAPEAVAVRYEDKSLSIHEILSIYAGLPAPRPKIETPDGFVAMIKPLITPDLMASEAVRRGLAAEPEFEHQLIRNRNALLRFHVHGVIEAKANVVLRGPNLDAQLSAWYREHAAAYAVPATGGGKRIPPFDELRERALADFSVDLCDRLLAEKSADLRRLHSVVVDEAVLQKL